MDSTHNRLHNIRHSNHSRQQQCQQLRQWFIISSRRYRSGCYCISWEIWKVFCDFMRIFLCITIDTDFEVFSSRINKNVKKDETKIEPSCLTLWLLGALFGALPNKVYILSHKRLRKAPYFVKWHFMILIWSCLSCYSISIGFSLFWTNFLAVFLRCANDNL